jgi:hypothetical protein
MLTFTYRSSSYLYAVLWCIKVQGSKNLDEGEWGKRGTGKILGRAVGKMRKDKWTNIKGMRDEKYIESITGSKMDKNTV